MLHEFIHWAGQAKGEEISYFRIEIVHHYM